jgi:hypothetical protein
MNAHITDYSEQEMEYQVDFRRKHRPARAQNSNRPSFRRKRGSEPQSFNGIHRRRAKRIRW